MTEPLQTRRRRPRSARGGSPAWVTESAVSPRLGRVYFAVQALAGAMWWLSVFLLDGVRVSTLGAIPPVPMAALDVPLFVVASGLAACGVRWAGRIAAAWTLLVAGGLAVYATVSGQAGLGALLMVAAAVGSLAAVMLIEFRRIPADLILRGMLGFGTARSNAPQKHLRRTLLQLTGFWIFFLALLPALIRFVELRWGLALQLPEAVTVVLAVLGGILLILASALGLWAAAVMSTRGDGTPLPSEAANLLVIAGPYLLVRNPMALAGIVQAAGVGLMLGSWAVVAYALCGAVYWDRLVRPFEEADLQGRFGPAYDDYRASVDCWTPRLRRRA